MHNPGNRLALAVLAATALGLAPTAASALEVEPMVELAFERLYDFDFDAAHAAIDTHLKQDPEDPLGYTVRGAIYLFYELDRLGILETEFFRSDEKIKDREKLKPDPEIRSNLFSVLKQAEVVAEERLSENAQDANAMFALCLKEGILTDYRALVDKRGLRSFGNARKANKHSLRLLAIEPGFYDAYLASGINEYLIGSLPFFVRWFVKIEGVEGDKEQAFVKLGLVADNGRYLGPFARILLSVMALREKEPERARALLSELTADYPENPLLRKELDKVNQELISAER